MTTNPLTPMGIEARNAARILATATTEVKNALLHHLAEGLLTNQETIRAANARDLAAGEAAGLRGNLLDRMTITPERLASFAADTRTVAALPDPIGSEYDSRLLPNGLRVSRRRTPLGVIGLIYEARPNVTIDIAALCLKTGNAVIMRGGKEIAESNLAILAVIHESLDRVGLPRTAVQYIENPDRGLVGDLLKLHDYVDMIIPRGGAGLHKLCRENSTIPVITGGIGICHIYVEESADLDKSLPIVHNAKTQRPSVCNSLDTLLVQESVAGAFLPRVVENLSGAGVTFRADEAAMDIVGDNPAVQPAGPGDFDTEWLNLTLGLRVVPDLDAAIEHIRAHSTNHSEAILTENWSHAQRFLNEVDSAAVFVNASTRFNDGGQFGLGAEVAVSTQKLHARGPMGLEELTTYKWVVLGDWHVRT
ncbi:MAG: glutamate-5-semialdehyde dehydrogenase [Caldilineales bacterium]|nr:glutamate-5-semialdehyde dehydrogenase [Caldilineales bacterium]